MIRKAVESDIPRLVAMGEKFHAMSPYAGLSNYDFTGVANVLRFMIGDENSLILTNYHGGIGGVIAPLYFDSSKRIMEESFWWAERGGRDLLKSFCIESKAMGADFVTIAALKDNRFKAINRVFTRLDFLPVEHRYIKGLK